jgi:CBS domain-containing protein
MTKSVVTCHVNDTLHDAAHQMWEHDCGVLPVVNDEGVLTAMITDRDICMAAYTQGRALDELLVNGAMAKHVVTIAPDRDIAEVAELMATHRIRRIPVIDDAGRPIGIVSLNDLAIEAAQPDTTISHATAKIAHTLAAISRHPAKEAA